MDGDPAVENELDSFSLTFPLPYRVAFIIVAAVWGWGLNLHYLYLLKIDVPSLIRYPGRSSSSQLPHHLSTYRLASVLSISSGASLLVFWLFSHRNPKLVIDYDWIPMTNLLVLALLFVVPLRSLSVSHTGRSRLLWTLRRVSIGGIAEAKDGKFGDILLADVLTSYAKVLGDLYVCLCMFFSHDGSATKRPDRSCGGTVVIPLLLAVPSAIRLRQCLIEYIRVRNAPYKESVGWGGQHLANAAKYSTAFPVIIFSALQRNLVPENPAVSTALYRAWVGACLLNSLYSFYWDVAKDWDLTLFSSVRERNSPEHPFGLRRRLLIHGPALYYAVIGLDLVLRCTWSLKLSPHLDRFTDFESSIFIIEFLEVLRRWIWIFFRVETEWVRNTSNGLGVDDILLGNYQGKDDDED
ncbi:EXS-domain-containing protein [Thozetella sp. PMI_491]|nr:EXS-domain-containing protein [Thozetella sp. PMI_491]